MLAENEWSINHPLPLANKSIYIAGHRGMVGSALLRRLSNEDCAILTTDIDLRDQAKTQEWMQQNTPDIVIIAAAHVGGIGANDSYPADFLYNNLMIETNLIHAAHQANVEKLLFLGSSCIYPKNAAQPITEDALLSGTLEPTNEAYAIAKIAGLKLCQAYQAQHGCNFISAMPCNLYGQGDRFELERSHVIPALIMKAHAATNTLSIWGSGKPLREFLYVDDLADALIFMLQHYSGSEPLNIGSGKEHSIKEIAELIANITGFKGSIDFDPNKPDGTMRKLMDSSRILKAGWKPKTTLSEGLENTYQYYLNLETSTKTKLEPKTKCSAM